MAPRPSSPEISYRPALVSVGITFKRGQEKPAHKQSLTSTSDRRWLATPLRLLRSYRVDFHGVNPTAVLLYRTRYVQARGDSLRETGLRQLGRLRFAAAIAAKSIIKGPDTLSARSRSIRTKKWRRWPWQLCVPPFELHGSTRNGLFLLIPSIPPVAP